MDQFSVKRQSHYFFAHKKLRQLLASEPAAFLNIMQSAAAPDFLTDLYNSVKAECNDQVDIGVTPKDFDVKVMAFGKEKLVLISLPETIIVPEAKYVGIVLPADITSSQPTGTKEIRYFTLERADNSANPDFVCGEWKNLGTHANYGTIEKGNLETFVAWIKQKLK